MGAGPDVNHEVPSSEEGPWVGRVLECGLFRDYSTLSPVSVWSGLELTVKQAWDSHENHSQGRAKAH
jgi:hypothetical protein